jgi:hypothetical protein
VTAIINRIHGDSITVGIPNVTQLQDGTTSITCLDYGGTELPSLSNVSILRLKYCPNVRSAASVQMCANGRNIIEVEHCPVFTELPTLAPQDKGLGHILKLDNCAVRQIPSGIYFNLLLRNLLNLEHIPDDLKIKAVFGIEYCPNLEACPGRLTGDIIAVTASPKFGDIARTLMCKSVTFSKMPLITLPATIPEAAKPSFNSCPNLREVPSRTFHLMDCPNVKEVPLPVLLHHETELSRPADDPENIVAQSERLRSINDWLLGHKITPEGMTVVLRIAQRNRKHADQLRTGMVTSARRNLKGASSPTKTARTSH